MAFRLEEFLKKYIVHDEAIRYLSTTYDDEDNTGCTNEIESARVARTQWARRYGGTVRFEGKEQELLVPSPFSKEGIPITTYKPSSWHETPCSSILVYFHGGGNVTASRKTHETVCRILASDTPCIVVNVEYQLAPEYKFPACQNDAKCVVEWVAAHKAEIGGATCSRLAVSGDSAGGRIAAVVCHEVRHLIDLAVLIYPDVDFSETYPSETEFIHGPSLSKPVKDWYIAHYLNSDADRSHVRASPILNTDFSDLPPTFIIVAELDPLRDSCYAYYDKLTKAGVESELLTIKGVPHGFWSLSGAFPKTCQKAYSAAVEFLKRHSF